MEKDYLLREYKGFEIIRRIGGVGGYEHKIGIADTRQDADKMVQAMKDFEKQKRKET